MTDLEIQFTHSHKTASKLRDAGFEPIECAFGQFGSIMGPLNMDHHGTESHREGVAIRACRDHYGERKNDPRFVVTGAPDADAVVAIIALAGLLPQHALTQDFYELVNAFDVDPIGIDLFSQPNGTELAWFNHIQGMEQSAQGFHQGINAMMRVLTDGLTNKERDKTVRSDRARRERAEQGVRALLNLSGHRLSRPVAPFGAVRRAGDALRDEARIVVVQSPVWGFDVWYRMAPVVVSYAERLKKITVGVVDTNTAIELLGPDGLTGVWQELGQGWGGRGSIGGSPRGEIQSFEDVDRVTDAILMHLRRR
jgi:hypothetical protein